MLHAREDYNRIQDPENKIGENEPVFIVRAKDSFSTHTMLAWADAVLFEGQLKNDNKLKAMAGMVYEHVKKTIEWQNENGCKNPDL